jgi:hypothetical protein
MLEKLLDLLWVFLNSAPGVAVVSAGLLAALNALYARKPAWARYEGTIIAAIRAAEKAIPDGVPMKSAERLDKALKFVLAVYAQREGREASPGVVAALAEAIQVTHSKLEAQGALEGPELPDACKL